MGFWIVGIGLGEGLVMVLPVLSKFVGFDRCLALAAWGGCSGFFVLGGDGCVLAANEHLCRLLDYTEGELVGLHFSDFSLARDRDVEGVEFDALVRGDRDYFHMSKTWVGKLNCPVSGHLFSMRFVVGESVFVVGQVVEGLSPEQVGAFAVMVRSLMEDWLVTQGLRMGKVGEPLWRSGLFWAAVGGAGAAWPIIAFLAGLFRRLVDVLYPH